MHSPSLNINGGNTEYILYICSYCTSSTEAFKNFLSPTPMQFNGVCNLLICMMSLKYCIMHQCSALERMTIVVIVVNLITLRQPKNKQIHIILKMYSLHIVYMYFCEAIEVLYHTPIECIGVRDLLI